MIRGYLRYPTSRLKFDGTLSRCVNLQLGIPQGVTYPTIFIVYINDISERLVKNALMARQADAFAVWNATDHMAEAQKRMQTVLNSI